MEGPFCGKCLPGYAKSKAAELCEKCPSSTVTIVFVLVQVAMIAMFSTAIYVMVLITDLTKPRNITAVILKQLLNYLSMSTVVFQATNLNLSTIMRPFYSVQDSIRLVFG